MASDIPTDLQLLRTIYDTHFDAFVAYDDDNKTRSSKMWMPVDLDALAERFETDPSMIFGRLHYHMNQKYGEVQLDGTRMDFFQLRVGKDPHCVNFPFLASVLADLHEDRRRFVLATGIATLSLFVSLVSLAVAMFV